MTSIVRAEAQLPPVAPEANAQLDALVKAFETLSPVDLRTEHHIHAGVYSRTLYMPAGTAIVGLTIEIPTQLIVCGHVRFSDGAHVEEIRGYHVFDGAAGRRGAFYALKDSALTMLFATEAKTVAEAENEFTNEPERLLTRKEIPCQER